MVNALADYFSLFYVLVISSIYLIQLISAAIGLRKYSRSLKYTDYQRFRESHNMVPISVLVPACNEAATIADNTRNLLSLDFPQYEVIAINDGSRDETMEILKESFKLVPIHIPFKRSLPTKEIRTVYRSAMMKLFLFAVIDNLGYRQLNTLYKVEAMSGFRRNRSSWGAIQRRAFRDDGKSGEKAAPEK